MRDVVVEETNPEQQGEALRPSLYTRAVVNSEYLLKFAVESGVEIPPDEQASLITAQEMLGHEVDEPTKVAFYRAYANLAGRLGDVTADTIKACQSPATKKELRWNQQVATGLAAFTVIVSVALFTAEAVNRQLTDSVSIGNNLAITLRGEIFPVSLPGERQVPLPKAYSENPCEELETPPRQDDFQIKAENQLERLQNFAASIRDTRSRAVKLNWAIYKWECDPYGTCSGDEKHNQELQKLNVQDRLELRPSITNYTTEFLCKVQSWQRVRDFALNVQKSYGATVGGFTAIVLPVLYAALGAFAYRLRVFTETVRNRTYHPSFADSARLITALIAGAVAGLFNLANELTVSPLAAAFLIGYGVEIFFRFLDSLLTGFGASAPGTARRPPTAIAAPHPVPPDGHSTIRSQNDRQSKQMFEPGH